MIIFIERKKEKNIKEKKRSATYIILEELI